MTTILEEQGIEVVAAANVTKVEGGDTKTVVAEVAGGERRFEAAEVLVATGRRPVLDGLDLEKAEIGADERGLLALDDELRTTNPRVYAAGDVTGAPQFVYVAAAQGTLVADNAIAGRGRKMDYKALPRVTFTTPNIAAVGLTDAQAQEQGYDCECRTLKLKDVPRAIVNLDTRGAIKIVAERGSGKVLGVHAIAANGGDVILAGVYAIKFGLTIQDLADTWAPYLTWQRASSSPRRRSPRTSACCRAAPPSAKDCYGCARDRIGGDYATEGSESDHPLAACPRNRRDRCVRGGDRGVRFERGLPWNPSVRRSSVDRACGESKSIRRQGHLGRGRSAVPRICPDRGVGREAH
jgi:hypothetical protein